MPSVKKIVERKLGWKIWSRKAGEKNWGGVISDMYPGRDPIDKGYILNSFLGLTKYRLQINNFKKRNSFSRNDQWNMSEINPHFWGPEAKSFSVSLFRVVFGHLQMRRDRRHHAYTPRGPKNARAYSRDPFRHNARKVRLKKHFFKVSLHLENISQYLLHV